MNTLLALLAIATAYGFIVTIMWLSEKAKHKDTLIKYRICKSSLEHQVQQRRIELANIKSVESDRDQLAQALKESQENLKISDNAFELIKKQADKLRASIQYTKVTRDPKTGRMVSIKGR